MNVDILRMVVCFLAGASTGAGITYLVVRDTFANRAQEDIDEMREYYENKSFYNDVVLAEEVEDFSEEELVVSGAEEIVKNAAYSSTSIDMDALKDKLSRRIEEAEVVVDRRMPYVITDDSYSEEFDHHEKVSWTWYEDDDTLADEGDKLVDARYNFIPADCLDELTKRNPVIYIRNENISLDVEIRYSMGTYAENVWGLTGDDEGPPIKRMRPQDE